MNLKITNSLFSGLLTYALPMLIFLSAIFLLSPFGNFPLNDDFVYSRDVVLWFQNGGYSITGLESAWGIPQVCLGVVLAKLFPFSHGLLRYITIVSALFCMAGIVLLLKRRGAKNSLIIFLVLGFAFCPLFFLLTPTFMTDIPFLALWIWTLVFWEASLDKKSYAFLSIGSILAILCVAQRQFGIALPISFAGIVLLKVISRRKISVFEVAVFAVSLVTFLSYFAIAYWWKTHSSSWSPSVPMSWDFSRLWRCLFPCLVYMGLFFFMLYVGRESIWERMKMFKPRSVEFRIFVLSSAVFSLLVLIAGLNGIFFPYFKNLISEFGVFNVGLIMRGARPVIISEFFQVVLTLIGLAGGILILLFVIRAVSHTARECLSYDAGANTQKSLNLAGFTSFAYFILLVIVRDEMADRYLLAVIPGLIILLSSLQKTDGKNVISILSLLIMICFSFSITSDYFRWNEARWEAGRLAVKQGLHPLEIEGGYEWEGWFRSHDTNEPDPFLGDIPTWKGSKEVSRFWAFISFSQVPDIPVINTVPYSSFWGPGKREMYLQGAVKSKPDIP